MKHKILFVALFVLLAALFSAVMVDAQGPKPGSRAPSALAGTAFTYQGQLKNGGAGVNGACDFQFGLWDALTLGAQVGTTQTVSSLTVANGLFTTPIDFGADRFNGDARWLAIATRCPAGSGSYTALTPRQELTATPYALTAMKTAYKNVLVVAKSGGHYNTISDALTSITDNSATNRYLIWIAPGTYAETVTMKQYVDIEGAGEIATKITQTGNASANTGTVVGANNAELRFLTVENTGGNTFAVAIYNSSAAPRLTQVTATASGATYTYGVSNSSSSPTMTNVTALASGGTSAYGVSNGTSSAPMMVNMTVTASGGTTNYGVYNSSSSPTMMNMTATGLGGGTTYGVWNTSSSPKMTNVTVIASGGNGNRGMGNQTSSTPTMTNVTVTASGGIESIGMVNWLSSPTMTNVTVTASGGTSINTGIHNDTSAPTMTNVTVMASGGNDHIGMYNTAASPTIQSSTISASGGSGTNYGIYIAGPSGTYTMTVSNSMIKGSSRTINQLGGITTRVGGSKLDGGAVLVGGGTVTCAGVYDENYIFYASTCP